MPYPSPVLKIDYPAAEPSKPAPVGVPVLILRSRHDRRRPLRSRIPQRRGGYLGNVRTTASRRK
ncbi:hypothetical protein GS506_04385 [Rhodococcus hoagii]|nr:hypothetical protein [Prescottella equi]